MSKIDKMLSCSHNIAIISHINPDADALASMLATKLWLKEKYNDKKIDLFIDGEISELYFPLIDGKYFNPRIKDIYDLAIVLDCPSVERTGRFADIVINANMILNIDHHYTNDRFGNLAIVVKNSTSTGEVLYRLFNTLSPITNPESNFRFNEYIYHCIITDSNNFCSNSMSKITHNVISDIVECGVDTNKIKAHYFKNIPLSKQLLTKKAYNSMQFLFDNRLSYMNISYNDFVTVGASFSDTLGIVENGLNIKGVQISAIFIEREPKCFYISLRGNGINVGEIAKIMGGGGSDTQSAFQYEGDDINEIASRLFMTCEAYLAQIPSEQDEFFF